VNPITKTAKADTAMRMYMQQGEQAFINRMSPKQCPHVKSSQEYSWWQRGYGNAQFGSKIKS